ncbi:L-dopachrome tautomerase-related protein [Nguyenibacter vanlangensis]|uniref:L-dopachrome tautomerase-related protein n=1 Tax=Nguyenibacter vanlangensis TaxID=1216886 RepID=A0ABZ3D6Y1_9PROT
MARFLPIPRPAGPRLAAGALTLLLSCGAPAAWAAKPAPPLDPSAPLVPVAQSDGRVWNAVVVLPDGRMVLDYPAWAGGTGPSLTVRDADGTQRPYPDAGWHDATRDPARRFISVEGLHLTGDGALWVVDSGIGADGRAVPGGAKLARIDTTDGTVTRIVPIDPAVLRPGSHPAGVRIARGHGFVGDSGVAGLIVIDLGDGPGHGGQRRLLDHHPSLTAQRPIMTGGRVLRGANGHVAAVNVNHLEVSPDGQWLYYQPLCGPLYRIGTDLLTDTSVTGVELDDGATLWYNTPPLGGMTVDRDGTLYFDDVSTGSIFRFTAGRIYQRIVVDPRLRWPAEPYVTPGGQLYVPVAQLDRTPRFDGGRAEVRWPLDLYRVDVGALPPPKY